jgi:molybdenum cofactor biosynthesis protein B
LSADRPFVSVGCAVLTVSDTRTLDNDTSGRLAADTLAGMGHALRDRRIVVDEVAAIREVVRGWIADPAIDVVVTTGGSGVTARDVTPEAIAPLATRHIPGFGELFRLLSYAEIGASTIQSRADAWVCEGTLVFVLPGSTGAVRLAMDKILAGQLDSRTRPCNFVELLPRIKGEAR